jgi:hypothetical protein
LPRGRGSETTTIRRQLAAHVLDSYLPAGGAVLDLDPHGGDVGHAALASGTAATVVAAPDEVLALGAFAGTFDLAVALTPEGALNRGEAHLPEAVAAQAADAIRPGGLAVLCVVGSAPVGAAVSVAEAVGLRYVQHVVALLPDSLDGLPPSDDRRVAHVDVLVFSKGRA